MSKSFNDITCLLCIVIAVTHHLNNVILSYANEFKIGYSNITC